MEKRLRGDATSSSTRVILVGGDETSAGAVRADPLSETSLDRYTGASSSRVRGIYRLVDCVTEADLPT